MECLREEFSFGGDGVEVTMEVNPGTVTRESLSGYRLAGVNRLSMGPVSYTHLLKGYRYNMHLRPRSLLIELGAQTNTVEEIKNACAPIAHILDLELSGKGLY